MDIAKLPAPESGSSSPTMATPSEQTAKAQQAPAAPADRVDIRALDLSSALQILYAEVGAALDSQALLTAGGFGPGATTPDAATLGATTPMATVPDSVQQAARALMEIMVQVQPEKDGNAQWDIEAVYTEIALRTGFERGISVVTSWRDVPATVLSTLNETRAFLFALLDEGPRNSIWLRPEWAGLAPKFERFWRRKRRARQRLTDPDYHARGFENDEQQS